jgi:hypothetical protein
MSSLSMDSKNCKGIYKSGPKKGQQCDRQISMFGDYCGSHMSQDASKKAQRKELQTCWYVHQSGDLKGLICGYTVSTPYSIYCSNHYQATSDDEKEDNEGEFVKSDIEIKQYQHKIALDEYNKLKESLGDQADCKDILLDMERQITILQLEFENAVKNSKNDERKEGEPVNQKVESDETICVVCMDAKRDVVLMPCTHNVVCYDCSLKLKECPVCRAKIAQKIKYISS